MRSLRPSAYTLVELLIALTLSLILLIGITELFQRVSGAMNHARATLNLSANLDGVAFLLRQDLARIPQTLPTKPERIVDSSVGTVSDLDGYLEITEGPDTVLSHPYWNEKGNSDVTVGDVDDIVGFTAIADPVAPFRGLIGGQIVERNAAEIVWFVRGNTLYRRVRLIDPQSANTDPTANTMEDLARREQRFGHDGPANPYPHPLYDGTSQRWYYLRMPTLEETLSSGWDANNWRNETNDLPLPTDHPDLWDQPYFFPDLQDRKSGSLKKYVDTPRHHRAGEDVVLTNVLSFDIKVWDSTTKEFVDLGTPGTQWAVSNQPELGNVWDSWTREYQGEPNPSPPFTEGLEAIQVTIRCFDPASRIIKQITVVHQFLH